MRSDRFTLIIKFKKTDLCGSPRFSCFRRIFPHSIFVAQRFERDLLRRLLRLLPFCGTIVFDNAYPYLWFVRRAFGSPDIIRRAGLSIRNLVGVFWRMILFPTDPDGGDVYSRCRRGGNAVFFGCGEAVHPDGAVGYRRVPALSALFHTLSQPLPVPKNGTFSLSRAQSRTCSGYAEARKRREKINFSIPRLPTVRILRLGKMQPKFALVLGLFVLWLRRRYSRSAMRK